MNSINVTVYFSVSFETFITFCVDKTRVYWVISILIILFPKNCMELSTCRQKKMYDFIPEFRVKKSCNKNHSRREVYPKSGI